MPWRALTLEVPAAQAETLSDALVERGAQSVWIGEPSQARPRMHALFDAGADAASVLGAAAAAAGCALPHYRSYDVADEDWVRATRAQFGPQCIAGKLWIVPSWDAPPPGARVVLRLDPGLAFGTGSHPSTRLVLAWLVARDLTRARVLDYGCGSGILAIAAARLGAARADAVDSTPPRAARPPATRAPTGSRSAPTRRSDCRLALTTSWWPTSSPSH